MVKFKMLVKNAPAVVTENLSEAIQKLIDMKKQGGFNVQLNNFKGIDWAMCLSTFDGLPFAEKDVYISIAESSKTADAGFYEFGSFKEIALISPTDAGYTAQQVKDYFGVSDDLTIREA